MVRDDLVGEGYYGSGLEKEIEKVMSEKSVELASEELEIDNVVFVEYSPTLGDLKVVRLDEKGREVYVRYPSDAKAEAIDENIDMIVKKDLTDNVSTSPYDVFYALKFTNLKARLDANITEDNQYINRSIRQATSRDYVKRLFPELSERDLDLVEQVFIFKKPVKSINEATAVEIKNVLSQTSIGNLDNLNASERGELIARARGARSILDLEIALLNQGRALTPNDLNIIETNFSFPMRQVIADDSAMFGDNFEGVNVDLRTAYGRKYLIENRFGIRDPEARRRISAALINPASLTAIRQAFAAEGSQLSKDDVRYFSEVFGLNNPLEVDTRFLRLDRVTEGFSRRVVNSPDISPVEISRFLQEMFKRQEMDFETLDEELKVQFLYLVRNADRLRRFAYDFEDLFEAQVLRSPTRGSFQLTIDDLNFVNRAFRFPNDQAMMSNNARRLAEQITYKQFSGFQYDASSSRFQQLTPETREVEAAWIRMNTLDTITDEMLKRIGRISEVWFVTQFIMEIKSALAEGETVYFKDGPKKTNDLSSQGGETAKVDSAMYSLPMQVDLSVVVSPNELRQAEKILSSWISSAAGHISSSGRVQIGGLLEQALNPRYRMWAWIDRQALEMVRGLLPGGKSTGALDPKMRSIILALVDIDKEGNIVSTPVDSLAKVNMGAVALMQNGAQVDYGTAQFTLKAIKFLYHNNGFKRFVLSRLARAARDPNYKMNWIIQKELKKYGLINQGGEIEESVKNVVLSGTTGENSRTIALVEKPIRQLFGDTAILGETVNDIRDEVVSNPRLSDIAVKGEVTADNILPVMVSARSAVETGIGDTDKIIASLIAEKDSAQRTFYEDSLAKQKEKLGIINGYIARITKVQVLQEAMEKHPGLMLGTIQDGSYVKAEDITTGNLLSHLEAVRSEIGINIGNAEISINAFKASKDSSPNAIQVRERDIAKQRTDLEIIDAYIKRIEAVSPDRMMAGEIKKPDVGGINLNPALLDLTIKRDGNGVPLPMTPDEMKSIQIDGFLPIIINVTPISNLPLLLGVSEDSEQDIMAAT